MIALHAAHVLTNAHLAQFQKATNTQSTQTYVLIAVPVQTSAHQALSPQANNLPPTENPIASPSTMMRMQFFLAPNQNLLMLQVGMLAHQINLGGTAKTCLEENTHRLAEVYFLPGFFLIVF